MKLIRNSKGTVFITTMVSMLMMVLAGGYMHTMADQGLHSVRILQRSNQAKYLAEAGLSSAFDSLRSDWDGSQTFASTNLGMGSYQASVAAVSGSYLVTSTGTVQGYTRTATAEVTAPGTSALDYLFAAGGNLNFDAGTGQSSGSITGDMYSGGDTNLDGPSNGGGGLLTITGDIDAGSAIDVGANTTISGTQTENYSGSVDFPTIDYAYLKSIAVANGTNVTYFATNKSFSSGAIPSAPAGGVIYVEGNLTIYGTQNTTACLVATGNINMAKTGSTYARITLTRPTSPSTLPAMAAQGNISFSSSGNGDAYLHVTGLIHTLGNFTLTGNHLNLTLTGSLIANGNIDVDWTAQNSTTPAEYLDENITGVSENTAEMTVISYNS